MGNDAGDEFLADTVGTQATGDGVATRATRGQDVIDSHVICVMLNIVLIVADPRLPTHSGRAKESARFYGYECASRCITF